MIIVPGYVGHFLGTLIVHQWHLRQNIFRPSVHQHNALMNEYPGRAEGRTLGQYSSSENWGSPMRPSHRAEPCKVSISDPQMTRKSTVSLSWSELKDLQGARIDPYFEVIVGHTRYPVFKLVCRENNGRTSSRK
jgi:hypothetical protein